MGVTCPETGTPGEGRGGQRHEVHPAVHDPWSPCVRVQRSHESRAHLAFGSMVARVRLTLCGPGDRINPGAPFMFCLVNMDGEIHPARCLTSGASAEPGLLSQNADGVNRKPWRCRRL